MKKYEYVQLIQKLFQGNYHWFLGDERLTDDLEYLNVVEALNEAGKYRWQAVHINNDKTVCLLMRDYI